MTGLCAPIWWLSWAKTRAEVVVSWYILCYGTSLGMASCFADLRATSPHSMFKRLYFIFLSSSHSRTLSLLYNWKNQPQNQMDLGWEPLEFPKLSFLSPPPKGDEFLLDLSAQIVEVQRWRVNLFSVHLVMSSGYVSRRSAVNRTPSSLSHSLRDWKRRPVCRCSTASLDPSVLGPPLSEALRALFCSGVSSTKSSQDFGWSDLSSSPQTSPILRLQGRDLCSRLLTHLFPLFKKQKTTILLFIPGWTGTHNNYTALASWMLWLQVHTHHTTAMPLFVMVGVLLFLKIVWWRTPSQVDSWQL